MKSIFFLLYYIRAISGVIVIHVFPQWLQHSFVDSTKNGGDSERSIAPVLDNSPNWNPVADEISWESRDLYFS